MGEGLLTSVCDPELLHLAPNLVVGRYHPTIFLLNVLHDFFDIVPRCNLSSVFLGWIFDHGCIHDVHPWVFEVADDLTCLHEEWPQGQGTNMVWAL